MKGGRRGWEKGMAGNEVEKESHALQFSQLDSSDALHMIYCVHMKQCAA